MTAERDALAALVAAWDSKAYRKEWGPRMTAAIDAARVVLAAQTDNDQSGGVASATRKDAGTTHCSPASDSPGVTLSTSPDPIAAPAQDMWTRPFNHAVPPFAAPAQGEPQERMGTHWDGCSTEGGPRHYDCAVAAIAALRAENERQARELAELRADKDAYHYERAERAEAERDALREALQAAAKAMNDECLYYAQYGEQPPQHLLDALDAARAKVQP